MNQMIGLLGYGLAALGSLFLFLLLLTTRQRTLQRTVLIITTALGACWGLILALQIYHAFNIASALASDTLRNAGWLILLSATLYNSTAFKELFHRWTSWVVLGLFMLTLTLDLSFGQNDLLALDHLLLLHLSQSVLALWLLEHIYRPPAVRVAGRSSPSVWG